jgi:hypothetical protein
MKISPLIDGCLWFLSALLGPFLFTAIWIIGASLYRAYIPITYGNQMNMGLGGAFAVLIILLIASLIVYIITSMIFFVKSSEPQTSFYWMRKPLYNRFWIHTIVAGLLLLITFSTPLFL